MVVVTGVWQYKASFAARDAREEATDGLQAGGGLGHASRWMELRGGDGGGRGRPGQRLGLQPRRASRDRVRSRGRLQALVGRGCHPTRAWHHHRPRRHDLAHRRSASHGPAIHAGGEAPADDRRSRHAVDRARRQAVQSAHARRDLAAHRRRLRLRRLWQLPRAQVRSDRTAAEVVGRARHRSRLLQHPAQHRDRRRRPRVRRRSRELARAGLRRGRHIPGSVEEPPPSVRARRRRAPRRPVLRRRAALAPAGEPGGAEHRRARERAVDQGRPRRAHRRAVRRREAGRVRGAARLRRRFARGSLRGGGVLDGGGQERKSAA